MTRKTFFIAAGTAATIFLSNQQTWCADDLTDIKEQITKRHDQPLKRLQDWIHQVSIAAENRGYPEGADYMIKLFFFFQAEDGIRDGRVTGVQTCALPISSVSVIGGRNAGLASVSVTPRRF